MQKLRTNDIINNIKTIQIEDLLNRKQIKLDNLEVKKDIFRKLFWLQEVPVLSVEKS
jgi:FlaA1/EpsC-like NDP-sugar epimerase